MKGWDELEAYIARVPKETLERFSSTARVEGQGHLHPKAGRRSSADRNSVRSQALSKSGVRAREKAA
jgi:hypothetical protein